MTGVGLDELAKNPPEGELILLEHQDRSLWNREQIAEGVKLVERGLLSRRFGPYTLQAAIAAVHAEADSPAATDWPQIVALYSVLARAGAIDSPSEGDFGDFRALVYSRNSSNRSA